MPLVVLAGQPASGKSSAAARLRTLLEPHGTVVVVDEPSLHLERNKAYASACAHKRGVPLSMRACQQWACKPAVLRRLACRMPRHPPWQAAATAPPHATFSCVSGSL
jgi:hypothetical protein